MKKYHLILTLSFLLGVIVFSCDNEQWTQHYSKDIPGGEETIYQYLKNNGKYSKLLRAFERTGLDSIIKAPQVLTLFAVTDEHMPDIDHMPDEQLKKRLLQHMAHGMYFVYQLEDGQRIKSLHGKYLKVKNDEQISINNSAFAPQDKVCNNGVLHTINDLLELKLNVYEYLYTLGSEYSLIKDHLLSLDEKVFDKENSKPISVDNQGNTVYDTVWVAQNELLVDNKDARKEDFLFTAFYPDNAVVEEAINKVVNDYEAAVGEMDDDVYDALYSWTLTSLFCRGIIENPADTMLTTTNGGKFLVGKQIISPQYEELSNGIAYRVEHLHVPKYMYMKKFRFDPTASNYKEGTKKFIDPEYVIKEGTGVYCSPMAPANGKFGFGWYGVFMAHSNELPLSITFAKTCIRDPETQRAKPVSLIPGKYKVYAKSGIMSFNIWPRSGALKMSFNDRVFLEHWKAYEKDYSKKLQFLGDFEIPEEWGTNPLRIKLECLNKSPIYANKKKFIIMLDLLEFRPTNENY